MVMTGQSVAHADIRDDDIEEILSADHSSNSGWGEHSRFHQIAIAVDRCGHNHHNRPRQPNRRCQIASRSAIQTRAKPPSFARGEWIRCSQQRLDTTCGSFVRNRRNASQGLIPLIVNINHTSGGGQLLNESACQQATGSRTGQRPREVETQPRLLPARAGYFPWATECGRVILMDLTATVSKQATSPSAGNC